MKYSWDRKKNEILISQGRPGFEQVVHAIKNSQIIDNVENSNTKHIGQYIFIVSINDYVCYVPYRIDDQETIFLITVIPSRKLQKKYRGKK